MNGEKSWSRHDGISPPTPRNNQQKMQIIKTFTPAMETRKKYQLHGRSFRAFLLMEVKVAPYWKRLGSSVWLLPGSPSISWKNKSQWQQDTLHCEMSESWKLRQHGCSHLLTWRPAGPWTPRAMVLSSVWVIASAFDEMALVLMWEPGRGLEMLWSEPVPGSHPQCGDSGLHRTSEPSSVTSPPLRPLELQQILIYLISDFHP